MPDVRDIAPFATALGEFADPLLQLADELPVHAYFDSVSFFADTREQVETARALLDQDGQSVRISRHGGRHAFQIKGKSGPVEVNIYADPDAVCAKAAPVMVTGYEFAGQPVPVQA